MRLPDEASRSVPVWRPIQARDGAHEFVVGFLGSGTVSCCGRRLLQGPVAGAQTLYVRATTL